MNLFQLLNGNNYIVVNREIARKIGFNTAVFLSELLDRYEFYKKNGQLQIFDDKEYFYITIEDAEYRTTLTRYEQDSSINKLIEFGLIEKVQKGLPAKRYFHIFEEKILDFLGIQINFACLRETNNQGCQPVTTKDESHLQSHIYIRAKERTKERESAPPPGPAAKPPVPPPLAVELSNYLFTKIKETKSDFKPPNMEEWAREMDYMLRIDKRTPESIRNVINWATIDSFWRANILSVSKLRKQFDKLQMQMEANGIDECKRDNTKFAADIKAKYPERMKHMRISGEFVMNTQNAKEVHLKMNPKSFREVFASVFGGRLESDEVL